MDETDSNFDAAERATLDDIGRQMRSEGWAQHVTVPRLLEDWRKLSQGVDRYDFSIDDYTNDLCSRDGLALALSRVDAALGAKLLSAIEQADREFKTRTEYDNGAAVGRYYRLDASSGWWWRRSPIAGPLAAYLADKTSM